MTKKMSRFCKLAKILLIFSLFGLSLGVTEISQKCLGCICEASSGCNTQRGCVGDNCGPFNIIKPYWEDAGSPNLKGLKNYAYEECTKDLACAAVTVQGYMNAYETDCNGDGRIDCDDFILLHWYGGGDCNGKQLPTNDQFTLRYQKCKQAIRL